MGSHAAEAQNETLAATLGQVAGRERPQPEVLAGRPFRDLPVLQRSGQNSDHVHAGICSYHLKYGHPFNYGFYYSGPYHNQWTYRCWYPGYSCYCYWCPCSCCWYYWCAPQNCYYPITYINIAAPGATAAPAAAGLTGLPTPPAGLMAPAAP